MGRAAKQQQQQQQQQQPPAEDPRLADLRAALQQLKVSPKKLRPQAVDDDQQIVLCPGVLTPAEAQRVIDAAEAAGGFSHQSSRGPAYGEAFRDNGRISLSHPGLARALWDAGLERVAAGLRVDGMRPVGLYDNIRIYKYEPGQRFGRHFDDSVEVAPGQVTGYTLLVYLSGQPQQQPGAAIDVLTAPAAAAARAAPAGGAARGGRTKRQKQSGPAAAAAAAAQPAQQQQQQQGPSTSALQEIVGGETVFYGHRGRLVASVRPQAGLALLHLHGEDRCLEHEGAEVLRGVKYVLRSDVVFACG